MNIILKGLVSAVIFTSVSLAAEDPELAAAIRASLTEQQQDPDFQAAIRAFLNEEERNTFREEQLILEQSLMEHKSLQHDTLQDVIEKSRKEHKKMLKDKQTSEEFLAIEESVRIHNEKQDREDAYFTQKEQQISYDQKIAQQCAAQEETEEQDLELQEALLLSTQTAQKLDEIETVKKLSLQVEPCKDLNVLIEAADALAAGTLPKNLELKNYFTNSIYLFKQEKEKSTAITEGSNISFINDEIERLKRAKARNAKAFTQAMNSMEPKIILVNLLKVKFPDYNDAQIHDILEEIGK